LNGVNLSVLEFRI